MSLWQSFTFTTTLTRQRSPKFSPILYSKWLIIKYSHLDLWCFSRKFLRRMWDTWLYSFWLSSSVFWEFGTMFWLYSSLPHSSLICWVRKASHSGMVCWSQLPSFIELCVSSYQKAADHICVCALFETSASTFSSIPLRFPHSACVVLKSGDPSLCPCSLLFLRII